MADALEKEKKVFEEKRADWLKTHKDKWVWVQGAEAKFFNTYEDAIRAAYGAGFDKQPIFVKQVTEKDEQATMAGYYTWAI